MKVFQKVNIVRFLALVLAVLCMVLVPGERVEAAEENVIYSGTFEANGVEINYYYAPYFEYKFNNGYGDRIFRYDANGHAFYIPISCNGNNYVYVLSFSPFELYETQYYADEPGGNRVLYANCNSPDSVNGKCIYCYLIGVQANFYDNNLPFIYTTFYADTYLKEYFTSDEFIDISIPPLELDFNSALDASWVWIEDFRASLEDTIIYMTWGEFKSTLIQAVEELKSYENRYIGFAAVLIDERYDTDKAYNDMIVTDVIFTEYEAFEGSLTLEDLGVPEGYRIWFLHAYPFWFWNDDPEGNLQKGKSSMITFDKDGNSSNALIKDSNDIYNPIDPDFSNWNAITNFTGNYFQNMQQTFNNTFQNYDASGMDDNTGNLEDGLKNYSNAQDVILDDVAANIAQYNPADYLNFTDSVMVAMGLVSGWINMFLNVSGEFTVVFIVGCVMVVFFVVLGIWRFQ